jgi:hypothetical protein
MVIDMRIGLHEAIEVIPIQFGWSCVGLALVFIPIIFSSIRLRTFLLRNGIQASNARHGLAPYYNYESLNRTWKARFDTRPRPLREFEVVVWFQIAGVAINVGVGFWFAFC